MICSCLSCQSPHDRPSAAFPQGQHGSRSQGGEPAVTAKKGHAMPCQQLMCHPTRAHLSEGQDLSWVWGDPLDIQCGPHVPNLFSPFIPQC